MNVSIYLGGEILRKIEERGGIRGHQSFKDSDKKSEKRKGDWISLET